MLKRVILLMILLITASVASVVTVQIIDTHSMITRNGEVKTEVELYVVGTDITDKIIVDTAVPFRDQNTSELIQTNVVSIIDTSCIIAIDGICYNISK